MCSSRFAILSVVAGALALAACGQLPRPFASDPDEPSPPDLLRPADGAGVVVDASRCAGDSAAALNEAVIAALVRHEVPAAGTGGNRGSMRLVCAESGGGATLRWALDGADGAPLGAFEQALSDFDPAADGGLAPLADDAAVRVLWLLGRNVPLPPSAVRPALVVTPIAGAPGNGAVALGRAMTKALEWRGATLALDDEGARMAGRDAGARARREHPSGAGQRRALGCRGGFATRRDSTGWSVAKLARG